MLGALQKVIAALALALPIGWEREHRTQTVGLRTFPVVAMASCAYVLVALGFVEQNPEAQSRIIQGIITGMGFIGGGAILKGENTIHGTATAAGLWATGAIGVAVALSQWEIAVAVAVMVFIAMQTLTYVEEKVLVRKDGPPIRKDHPGAPPTGK